VAVNGQVVAVQGFKVIPAKDQVTVDGRQVKLAAVTGRAAGQRVGRSGAGRGGGGAGAGAAAGGVHQLHYFAVHKPTGFICRWAQGACWVQGVRAAWCGGSSLNPNQQQHLHPWHPTLVTSPQQCECQAGQARC